MLIRHIIGRHIIVATAAMAVPLLLAVTSVPASAGDLYDSSPRTGSAYDDPRYADIYGDRPARRYDAPRYAEPRYEEPRVYSPRYAERHEPLPPRAYRDEYLAPMPGVKRFDRHNDYDRSACIDKGEARQRLIESGWRDFQDLELRADMALITARRGNGQAYRLKLDRCTGEILNARAIDGYPDSYAERPGRRYSY